MAVRDPDPWGSAALERELSEVMQYQVRVGEWELEAEIDDLSKPAWRGVLAEAPNL